jgi:hypothetical protein
MKNVIIQESAFNGEVSITQDNKRTIEFIAVLQEADKPNRNGRVYPKAVLEHALNSPYVRERIATKTFYSEAGHPLDTSVQRQMTIDQRNIACIIKEFWWEGDLLKGRIETADTAVGRDMMGLIKQGSRVAFSLRAQGNVHTNPATGLVEVEEGLQICSYDWVVNPSHAKAFLEKICEETVRSLYGVAKNKLDSQVLCESVALFEDGAILTEDDTNKVVEKDYTKNYNTNFKKLEEMYVPEAGDEVSSLSEDVTLIRNGNTVKKVLTEDYLVKDIRKKLLDL